MNVRNLAVWGLIAALLIGMMMAMQSNGATAGADEINISEVRSMAEAGQIEADDHLEPNRRRAQR